LSEVLQLMIVYPRTINHIAVSVTNLDKAVKWYQEVFGFDVINGPVEIVVDDSPLGIILKDIHGPNLKKIRVVWLSSGSQVGFEIFEYIDPKAER
jgi:catechol 2,3-dioxygenase-like lactoylglutathione lyase family enzyme